MSEKNNQSGWRENKWIRGAIPALLLHMSIGTVYCWSIFSQEIANYIGWSKSATEWAFSFAIFFLGMSAAFLGNVVEKDIHKSSLIATICFAGGMAGTGFSAGWHEPTGSENKPSTFAVIKSKPIATYIGIWLMFYLNITCGLALISQEKAIVKCIGLAGMVGIISTITAIFNAGGRLGFSAMADGMKDRNTVYKIIFAISIAFTALTIITGGIKNAFVDGSSNILLVSIVLCLLFAVNAGYGGGFSNVPNLLSDHYGMSNISAIHGITLSAWAIAGLTGNQMANAIVNSVASKHPELLREVEYHGEMITVNPVGYQTVLYVTGALYVVSLLLSIFLVRPSEAALAAKKAKAK